MERYNISKKDYEAGDFIRIENFPLFDKIFQSYWITLKNVASVIGGNLVKIITGDYPAYTVKQTQSLINLTKNNKQLFIDTFGKQDFVWTYEYKHYAWGFKFPSGILIIFTGNKGTSYEFNNEPNEKDVVEFKKILDFIIDSNDTIY
jgi:hypothetical protein